MIEDLMPEEIVKKLGEFIIGQDDAKKAVAIALRNRSRRMALGEDSLKDEIHPKNIIMMGPTGVGKTEIARRLAKLVNAPFVKVEATKYTEVGYVGRDVESMVRDLVSSALKMVREEHEVKIRKKAEEKAEERILDILLSGSEENKHDEKEKPDIQTVNEEEKTAREIFRKKLKTGTLEDREVEIKTSTKSGPVMQVMAVPGMEEMESQMQNLLGDLFPKKKARKKIKISEARKLLIEEEVENLLDHEKIREEAVKRAEESGIIFIDEIDKIASRSSKAGGPDVSREGVQRDILPLVEGSTVNTRHGPVKTDHVLFLGAGAFHMSSISDLIPELQGRFPLRVELKALKKEDYSSILHNPKNALTKQYQALMSTEGIALEFDNSGIEVISQIAFDMNVKNENIGARRLHTIMEKVLEEISFYPKKYKNKEIKIDGKYVEKQLKDIVTDQDLSKYIL